MQAPGQVQRGSGFGAEQVRFSKVPEKVLEKVPEKVWEALVQRQVRFNRVPDKLPEKAPGSLGAKPSQVQQGSGKGSGEGREALVQSTGRCSTGFQRRFRRRSGRLWCRDRSCSTGFRRGSGEGLQWEALVQNFNRVPKKVPEKVPGGFGAEQGEVQQVRRRFRRRLREALAQSEVRFNRVPGDLVQSQVKFNGFRRRFRSPGRFNRVSEKVPEKVAEKAPGGFGAEPSQVQQALVQSQVRFNRVPEKFPEKAAEKAPGGFGAEPSQVQQGSGEGAGEVAEKAPGGFGAEPGQVQRVPEKVPKPWEVQQGFGEGSGEGCGEGSGRLWCRAKSGSTGFWRRCRRRLWRRLREALVQSQVRFNRVPEKFPEKAAEAKPGQVHLTHGKSADSFQRLASQHASERFVKIKRCGCWGYHRSLFAISNRRAELRKASVGFPLAGHWAPALPVTGQVAARGATVRLAV